MYYRNVYPRKKYLILRQSLEKKGYDDFDKETAIYYNYVKNNDHFARFFDKPIP
jgi:hypothetical protein